MRRLMLTFPASVLTLLIGMFASAMWNASYLSTPDNQDNTKTEHEVLEIEHQYAEAVQRHDVEFINRLKSDDYTLTLSSGRVVDKAEVLRWEGDVNTVYEEYANDNVQVHVYGDTAVVSGLLRAKAHDGSGWYTKLSRWADMFVRQNGHWRMVNSQMTNLIYQLGKSDDLPDSTQPGICIK